MTLEVLIQHAHPLGACYLARDGQAYLAGRSPESAKRFPDARAVYDAYRPWADEGLHWAWNLCYFVEDHIA